MGIERKISILNLATELNSSLNSYFCKELFSIVTRAELESIEQVDYIFVNSISEANSISKEYNTSKYQNKFICFGEISSVRDFLLVDGRLILDRNFNADAIGSYVLDKFFKDSHTIHLDEAFINEEQDIQKFKITNHLSTGTSIDELSVFAFEKDFNIVPIRSFVDHTIYYLTYLKQSGLAGIPFEFEYTNSNEKSFNKCSRACQKFRS